MTQLRKNIDVEEPLWDSFGVLVAKVKSTKKDLLAIAIQELLNKDVDEVRSLVEEKKRINKGEV